MLRPAPAAVLAAVLVLALAAPGTAETRDPSDGSSGVPVDEASIPEGLSSELDEARERRERIESRLATTSGDIEGLEQRVAATQDAIAALQERDEELRSQLDDVQDALSSRARDAYTSGPPASPLQVLLTAESPSLAAERAARLDAVARRDRGTLEQARALRDGLAQTRRLRAERLSELSDARARLADQMAQLERDLERAQEDVDREALEASGLRRLDTELLQGLYACPVGDPVFFANTWGAPRSGGRSHKGVDMMAPAGTPIFAITDGQVTRMKSGGLGGTVIYMYGDDGNEYYYAHLQEYAEGVTVGSRVEAGQLIARNGSTGNASAGAPHLHLEVHPGGGAPTNPYFYAAPACGRDEPGRPEGSAADG